MHCAKRAEKCIKLVTILIESHLSVVAAALKEFLLKNKTKQIT